MNIRHVINYAMPVLIGYILLGGTFGALMQAQGYPLWMVLLMCLVVYGGSIQFAGIGLLHVLNPGRAALLSLVVNARHLVYGIALMTRYQKLGRWKWPAVLMLSDETFALVTKIHETDPKRDRWMVVGVSLADYLCWAFAGTLGFLLADTIGQLPEGLDFVLSAFFTVSFLEALKQDRRNAWTGFLISLCSLWLVKADHFMMLAMILIGLVLAFREARHD